MAQHLRGSPRESCSGNTSKNRRRATSFSALPGFCDGRVTRSLSELSKNLVVKLRTDAGERAREWAHASGVGRMGPRERACWGVRGAKPLEVTKEGSSCRDSEAYDARG